MDNDVQGRISYAGPGLPLPPINEPITTYERLFSRTPVAPDTDTRSQSILDAVSDQFTALRPRLGQADRAKLDEHLTRDIGAAFAGLVSAEDAGIGSVVIGHDMRASSPPLAAAFADGVTGQGLDVVLIGLASTDMLYFASGYLDMPGAMFTASHNPARYNGIKLCRAAAQPVGQDTGLAELRDLAQWLLDGLLDGRSGLPAPRTAPGTIEVRDLLAEYSAFLRGLVDLSGSRPLKVVVDAGNGMGGLTVPAVLGTAAGLPPLPLEIVPLYFELDGSFPNHEANPLDPANLVDLQEAVRQHGADVGLAFDGDADRCFVVDADGEPVSPSAITGLVAAREIGRARSAGERDVAVVHNAIVFEQTQAASLTDPLTGLPNTRFMANHLARELSRAERGSTEVSLIVMDLDDFKDINDGYGHQVGDRALREVATVLRGVIRPYDVCVRYAGDEFIVVLAGCGWDEAESKRLELQAAVERLSFEARPGEQMPLAISAGTAVFPIDGVTYESLLAKADSRMYRNKVLHKRDARQRRNAESVAPDGRAVS